MLVHNFSCVCTFTHMPRHTQGLGIELHSCSTQSEKHTVFLFRWTDGCREYTLPQNDAVLINLTYRVTELTPQAALLCFGSKYTWF